MWLEWDERRLLAGYYFSICDVEVENAYCVGEIARLLTYGKYRRRIPGYGHEPPSQLKTDDSFDALKRDIPRYIQSTRRVELANKRLAERQLIHVKPHQHDKNVVVVSLTLNGFDFGRRYCSWFQRSGLRFSEYRNHWIWLIVALLGGGIASKAIELLFKLLANFLKP